jgi:hypothetical protein
VDDRDRITIRLTPTQAARLGKMATRWQLSAAEVLRRCPERVSDADLARSASAPEVSASPPLSMADGPTVSTLALAARLSASHDGGAPLGRAPEGSRGPALATDQQPSRDVAMLVQRV